ncbi:MAG: hypothetical protein LOD94_12975 [Gammaproteobacteria bacterium]|nr:hypothetical protein [Gammaproteobacteria bacterium]
MSEKREESHWFGAKTYGIGWTPVTWQGWVVVIVFVVLVIGGMALIDEWWLKVAYAVLLIVALVFLAAWKGEKPFKWRWGRG